MSRLGIERQNGLVYEGKEHPSHLTVPAPIVSQCKLIESSEDLLRLPTGMGSDPFCWIFREDSFDPVSRVRRGRLFQSFSSMSWERLLVDAHPFASSDYGQGRTDGRVSKELAQFIHCTYLLNRPRHGEGLQLAIGGANAHTLWRILQTEVTVNDDVLVTLRAESAFDVLPLLNLSQIPNASHAPVVQAYERVLNVAYRDSPTSVIDQCRNLCAVVAARWLFGLRQDENLLEDDLGTCISAIKSHFGDKQQRLVRAALETVNLLHPRGKENERQRYSLRAVSADDATLALHATGFVLREIGWAM